MFSVFYSNANQIDSLLSSFGSLTRLDKMDDFCFVFLYRMLPLISPFFMDCCVYPQLRFWLFKFQPSFRKPTLLIFKGRAPPRT